jgi:hypothetical protein
MNLSPKTLQSFPCIKKLWYPVIIKLKFGILGIIQPNDGPQTKWSGPNQLSFMETGAYLPRDKVVRT